MLATERRRVREARLRLTTGDRAGALAILRDLEEPRCRAGILDARQLMFRFMLFRCRLLGVDNMSAAECVRRQLATDAQRTQQSSRGQGTDFPSCDSRTCTQGSSIRDVLGPKATAWRGAGEGWLGRFQGQRTAKERAAQEAARARAEREGMLEPVRVLDVDEDPKAEGG